jgi:hypothetical protein
MNAIQDVKEALFSANIHHFLPEVSWESHPEIYQNCKKYHGPKREKEIKLSSINSFLNFKPGVIVLFHLGYHLQVIQFLAKEHICFDILVSKQVKTKFENYFKTLSKDLPPHVSPNYFEAEDRTVLLKIRESLKSKRHIVIFADGFISSVATKLNGSEYVSLDFFSNKIFVRKGIALISYYFSAPIYPLINMENENSIILDVKSPITVKSEESKDQYINRCLQSLFNLLELRIKDNIEHWECWSYLHHVGAIKPPPSNFSSSKMTTKIGLVKINIGGRDILFDKNNYHFYVIEQKNNS